MMLKEHEKFFAFILLGGAIVGIVFLIVFHPVTEGSGSQRIVDSAIGGLLLAFGGAANALFRITDASEQKKIGEATATAIANGPPIDTKVTNTEVEPVPTETAASAEELPDYAR